MFAAIEAGGTKIISAIADEEFNIIDKIKIPTTSPSESFGLIRDFLMAYKDKLKAIGVGSFGPIDIDEKSRTYGQILNTPKKGWSNFNIYNQLNKDFDIKITITSDVNASAYGEYAFGLSEDKKSLVYFTVGTGIGAAYIQDGLLIGGRSHPEMGHMIINKHQDDGFKGSCPYHGPCLEGLGSGPAISQRLNKLGEDLDKDDKFWDIEANYLGQAALNTSYMFNPDCIIFGGGVMAKEGLIEKIRENFERLNKSYMDFAPLDEFIIKPKYDGQSAILGCLKLAKESIGE
ncbi:MAG: ROK family protein [Anaerococcus sp.]|nr:ROK family protein [Anaerococcus sp.]